MNPTLPPVAVPQSRAGFTLIELLTVIAIIGILAAILIPTVSSGRQSANKAKTRVQFTQWAAAIEAFRAKYGYYPVFDDSNLVNGGAGSEAGALHPFHDLLAGRRRDGTGLPAYSAASPRSPEAQNRKHIAFYAFTETDFTPANLLQDAFGNTQIVVLVDRNLDGSITPADYPGGWPAVGGMSPGDAELPAASLRTGVAFYAPAPGATPANPGFIVSWQ
jgi:prepilin-type N-terminal cleavage/methylation domain-containing protein